MTTEKQKKAVAFCESMCDEAKFEGDINDFDQVSSFLSEWLDHAKCVASEIEAVNWFEISGYD